MTYQKHFNQSLFLFLILSSWLLEITQHLTLDFENSLSKITQQFYGFELTSNETLKGIQV